MALNPNQIPIYAITPRTAVGILNAATAGSLGSNTNSVSVITASASGTRVTSMVFSTDDTTAVNVFVFILDADGVTVKPIGMVTVAINAGNTAATSNVDGLDSLEVPGMAIDSSGKRYFDLQPNDVLKIACLANMTAAKKLHCTVFAADYE